MHFEGARNQRLESELATATSVSTTLQLKTQHLVSQNVELEQMLKGFERSAQETSAALRQARHQLADSQATVARLKEKARVARALSGSRQNASIERFLDGGRSNAKTVSGHMFHHPKEVFEALGITLNEDGSRINQVRPMTMGGGGGVAT